jgi:succinate dehydrogenase/fumarate reductase flavoprotein subunit
VDIIKDKGIMVAPSCHFFPGGVKINENTETDIPGLYAAGEVASGTMGGDRISGCAFTEMTTHGKKAGMRAAEYVKKAKGPEIDEKEVEALKKKVFRPLELNDGVSPIELKKKIQKIAGEKLSSVRNDPDLEKAIQEIEEVKKDLPKVSIANKSRKYNVEWVDALQIESMLLVIEMVARASLMRKESRSGLYRKDYPRTDWKNWTKNIVIKKGADGKMQLTTRPPVITTFEPPKDEEEAKERGLAFYYPK